MVTGGISRITGGTQRAAPDPGARSSRTWGFGVRRWHPGQRSTAARLTARMRLTAAVWLTTGALACAPSGTDAGTLPPNIPDPSTVQTPAGALAFYRRVINMLPSPLDRYVGETGIFTDELAGLPAPSGRSGAWTLLDSRSTAATVDFYVWFHDLRGQAREARGFLDTYALPPDSTDTYNERDLRAYLFALEGYADVLLADLYCSGIPLSTVDFQGDYTLTPGYTTKEVYLHAKGLFDSALALVSDSSARFQPLAAVGKGRALLGAGQFAEAAAAVAGVPDGYQYQVLDENTDDDIHGDSRFIRAFVEQYAAVENVGGIDRIRYHNTPGMGDSEGLNGLPYVSSHDPRTPATELGPGPFGGTMYFPTTYGMEGAVALTLASSVEARLIEAEAALQGQLGGADWLTRLNALRTDGTFEVNSETGDTLWRAGTGGMPGLKRLEDPSPGEAVGPTNARVDLLFRERAFWLYLSGHRQGDLRRLIRQYGRHPLTVYPSGTYLGGVGRYGQQLVAPVPDEERRLNPQYTGCIHSQA